MKASEQINVPPYSTARMAYFILCIQNWLCRKLQSGKFLSLPKSLLPTSSALMKAEVMKSNSCTPSRATDTPFFTIKCFIGYVIERGFPQPSIHIRNAFQDVAFGRWMAWAQARPEFFKGIKQPQEDIYCMGPTSSKQLSLVKIKIHLKG